MSQISIVIIGSPRIVVDLDYQLILTDEEAKRLATAWKRGVERRPWIHDGDIFYVTNLSHDEIRGGFYPYRYFVAQQEDPLLAKRLNLAPLGVTGRTRALDGSVVLGRRGRNVNQDAGLWELAPAGGIPRAICTEGAFLNPQALLEAEFEEELGIESDRISNAQISGLLHDSGQNVYDLIVDLQLSVEREEVERLFCRRTTTEYVEIGWLSEGESLRIYEPSLSPLVTKVFELPFPF